MHSPSSTAARFMFLWRSMTVLATERAPEIPEQEQMPRVTGGSVDVCVRWLLAACSLGAAAIHFAYTPSHLSEYWLYGVFFIVLAWSQLLWAVGVVVRSRRWLLLVGYAANTVVIVVWVLSRTIGVWVGPNAKVTEAVGYPDVLATVLESVVVLGALLLLARPTLRAHRFKA